MDDYEEENHDEIIQDVENTAINMGDFIDIGIALGKLDDVIQNVEDSKENKNHKEDETEVLDYLDDVIQDVENNYYNDDTKPKIPEETIIYEIL